MSNKPLHLQQERYKVRSCRVVSARAQGGYAVNYWYIHDTEYDDNEWLNDLCPTVGKYRTFRTRKDAVKALNIRLVQSERIKQAEASDRCVGLERRFRLV